MDSPIPRAARLASIPKPEQTIQVQPEPDENANTLVMIPYPRIRQHRQYAAPNQHGFTVTLVGS